MKPARLAVMQAPRLEVPIFGPTSALSAVSLGAARLEVNAAGSYILGGATPSLSELDETVAALGTAPSSVALRVMVRPRGPPIDGSPDFLYSAKEFAEMRETIIRFRESGLLDPDRGDGFVFGVLKQLEGGNGRAVAVDVERNAELVRLARPFASVFHRAFDDVIGSIPQLGQKGCDGHLQNTRAWERALEDVTNCDFRGILTSGGPGNAGGNTLVLKGILACANGRIEVIIGGGVRSTNIRQLAMAVRGDVPPDWFHSSCLTSKDEAGMVDDEEIRAISRELGLLREGAAIQDL